MLIGARVGHARIAKGLVLPEILSVIVVLRPSTSGGLSSSSGRTATFPGLAITVVVPGPNLVGDALRDGS